MFAYSSLYLFNTPKNITTENFVTKAESSVTQSDLPPDHMIAVMQTQPTAACCVFIHITHALLTYFILTHRQHIVTPGFRWIISDESFTALTYFKLIS